MFPRLFQELNAYYAFNGTAFLLELLVLMLAACMSFSLQFYAALAVGHSFANHKMALSVAFFFAFQFVMQMVSGVLLAMLDQGPLREPAGGTELPGLRHARHPHRHGGDDRPDGDLRRGVLHCNHCDLEKAPELGVN